MLQLETSQTGACSSTRATCRLVNEGSRASSPSRKRHHRPAPVSASARSLGKCSFEGVRLDSGAEVWNVEVDDSVDSICYEPGLDRVVVAGKRGARVHAGADGRELFSRPLPGRGTVFRGGDDRRSVVLVAEEILVLDHELGIVRPGPVFHRGGARTAHWWSGPDGPALWTGGARGEIALWEWKDPSR